MTRLFDLTFSLIGLIILSPFFLIIAIWIKLTSKGPILYRQKRIGKNGKEFRLLKFRSMYADADKRGLLTVGGKDPRITPSGLYIRKYKLDELPQLWNVLIGQMSIVGPRPEVKKYVDLYDEEQKKILHVRPGITDLASIKYKNENEILEAQPEPERYYIEHLLPEKIKLNKKFIEAPTVNNYFKIIFLTVKNVFISKEDINADLLN
ncbi:MAG TPA: sugar transferase [Flavipsychrobacter sp.]|nr:sugar transferase [Flavipsychrobacter sp.]